MTYKISTNKKLTVKVTQVDPVLKTASINSKPTSIHINSITPITVNTSRINMSNYISDVSHNELTVDNDNKLLSHATDTDFTAYYIISKG